MIRYHLDESADGRLFPALSRRGIDVTTPTEQGLLGATDQEQLDFATSHGRVLVTQDTDFLAMHHSGIKHAGIAYDVPGHRTVSELVRHLCLLHDCVNSDEMVGRVEYV